MLELLFKKDYTKDMENILRNFDNWALSGDSGVGIASTPESAILEWITTKHPEITSPLFYCKVIDQLRAGNAPMLFCSFLKDPRQITTAIAVALICPGTFKLSVRRLLESTENLMNSSNLQPVVKKINPQQMLGCLKVLIQRRMETLEENSFYLLQLLDRCALIQGPLSEIASQLRLYLLTEVIVLR